MNPVSWLVPAAAREDAAQMARYGGIAKSLLTISVTVVVLFAGFLVLRTAPSKGELLLFFFAAVTPTLGALLIRFTGNITLGLLATNFAGIAIVAGWAAITGGIVSFATPWFMPNLVLLSTFGSVSMLVLTAGVLVLTLVGLYFATYLNWLPPSVVPPEAVPDVMLLAMLSSVGVVVLGAASVHRARARSKANLRSARDAALIASRAKSAFLSSMSHELRTPLTAVLGYAEVLGLDTQRPLSPTQQQYLGHIMRSGEHLLALINQVLEMSRIEAGEVELQMEQVDVPEAIAASLAVVEGLAQKAGVSLVPPTLPMGAPQVRADATRLKQALINLLSNAVKYNREGGRVEIACTLVSDGYLRVSVSDTGRGIPSQYRDDVFTAFARAGAESGRVEGSGLGLTITRRLVEMMAGRIGFTSIEGEGSTFWIELPLARRAGKDGA